MKYNQAKGPKIWRLVVPSNFELFSKDFALFLDKQSGEDSGIFIRKPSLWTKFVHTQEDKMRAGAGHRVRFILAECTGLQVQVMSWSDSRYEERYVFDYHSMFEHRGKKLTPVDCVFFPSLSSNKNAMPLLKGIKYVFYYFHSKNKMIPISEPSIQIFPFMFDLCFLALPRKIIIINLRELSQSQERFGLNLRGIKNIFFV